MNASDRSRTGLHWERVAESHLRRNGLQILQRRYRCRMGELDLVCRDDEALIVVEVRARATTKHADALQSIGRVKRLRIINATRHFLMRHPHYRLDPIRFDVVAIDSIDSGQPKIDWVKNAFADT